MIRITISLLLPTQTLLGQKPALTPEKLISKMEEALGGKDNFYKLHDVQFDYTFEYTESGKKDVSVEKMIFDGEHTWAKYTSHNAIVMPDKKGDVIHAIINGEAFVHHNGQLLNDEKILRSCRGIREANYYWFTMMYKLSDPGVKLTSVGQETIGNTEYHKIKVDYDIEIVGKENNDAYLLYINASSHLVEHFYFAIPEDGSHQGVRIDVQYETVSGVKVPAKRSAFMPDEEGNYSDIPRLVQTSKNFKFNNRFTTKDLLMK